MRNMYVDLQEEHVYLVETMVGGSVHHRVQHSRQKDRVWSTDVRQATIHRYSWIKLADDVIYWTRDT